MCAICKDSPLPNMRVRSANRRRDRGQSLTVAIIVLFILLFIGGVFVALVARNLLNMGRARDVLGADEFARAGIKYAEYYLQYSPLGADWRPAPEDPANIDPRDPDLRWIDPAFTDPPFSRVQFGRGRALIRVSYEPGYVADPRDSSPVPEPAKRKVLDPLGKMIKIEAIGRFGVLNPQDPTTFLNTPAPRLRREYVAYKAIGITDYLRFVTNRSGDSKAESFLGVPPVSIPTPPGYGGPPNPLKLQLGKLPVRTLGGGPSPLVEPGAPIRVNNSVLLGSGLRLSVDRRNAEFALFAGDVTLEDPQNPPTFIDGETGGVAPILASDNLQFSTFGGLFRDAASFPDAQGYARSISVQPPPNLSEEDPASRVSRYRALTRESGRWIGPAGSPTQFNTGRFGFGEGLYIDNEGNRERESENIPGGQSLRSLWMRPGNGPYWNGPFYIPPGVFIELGYPIVQERDANGNLVQDSFVPRPGFRVVRDATDRPFRDPNGNIAPREMSFTFFIYKPADQKPVLKLENEFFRDYLKADLNLTEADVDKFLPPFNGVIFAEGNVRIRGLLPSKTNIPVRREAGDSDSFSDDELRDICDPPSLTIVSDASIYVEGSLVREAYQMSGGGPSLPGGMIALLAEDYVVVNATLIMAPNRAMPFGTTYLDEQPPYHTNITLAEPASTPPFALDFLFGDDPAGYTTTSPNGLATNLLVRHGSPSPSSFMNLFVNEAFTDAAAAPPVNPVYLFNTNGPPFDTVNPPPNVYVLPNPALPPNPGDPFEQRAFPLFPRPNNSTYAFFNQPGLRNQIRFAVDPNFTSVEGTQDYLFARAAVVPMDVRIEAVMYAETGSFYIIPGYSFNPNPADTRDAALRRALDAGHSAGDNVMLRPPGTSEFYPFYGEPLDVRITIVGAISENRTAPVADQAAWMQLWGYIPEVYGSTGNMPPAANPNTEFLIPDQHIGVLEVGMGGTDMRTQEEKDARITRGLRFLYDPFLHAPYPGYVPPDKTVSTQLGTKVTGTGGWSVYVGGAMRQDDHGRALPPLPRLPVCPGFVFYGEVR